MSLNLEINSSCPTWYPTSIHVGLINDTPHKGAKAGPLKPHQVAISPIIYQTTVNSPGTISFTNKQILYSDSLNYSDRDHSEDHNLRAITGCFILSRPHVLSSSFKTRHIVGLEPRCSKRGLIKPIIQKMLHRSLPWLDKVSIAEKQDEQDWNFTK